MELTRIIYKNEHEFALHVGEDGKLFIKPIDVKLDDEALTVAQGYLLDQLEKIVLADKPYILDAVTELMMFNQYPEPFISDYIQVAQVLDAGLVIHFSKTGTQYFLPTDAVVNPDKYFDKVTADMYNLKGTKDIYPDIVALWGSLEERHPLNVMDKPVAFKTEDIEYNIEESIELDQFEVHRVEIHDEEEDCDYDAIVAINKMNPEVTHFMYVDVVRTSTMDDADLDICARWLRYFSVDELYEQDIFGRALREFNFLRY